MAALEDYLIEQGTEGGPAPWLGRGNHRAGPVRVVEEARQAEARARGLSDALPASHPRTGRHRRAFVPGAPMPTCRAWPTGGGAAGPDRAGIRTRLAGADHAGSRHPPGAHPARGGRGAHARRADAARARRGALGRFTQRPARGLWRARHLHRKDRSQPIYGPLDLLTRFCKKGKRACRCSATRAGRNEPRSALGNHAGPGGAHAFAGEGRRHGRGR
jgi:DNA gyrase subunit B